MATQNQPAQATQATFNIQRIYLRDMSLEIPNAPQVFLETEAPMVEVQLDVSSGTLAANVFEATVTVTLTTKHKEKVAFLVEGKQAGIFDIANVPAEQLQMILNIVCPSILYPYLRSNVADVVQRAGFPPIHLAEINFEAFYQERLRQAAAAPNLVGATSGNGLPN
jgi:preprotein translocase subunit SecB